MVEIIAFFASIAYAFVIQHFSAPFMVIMNFYAGISVINLSFSFDTLSPARWKSVTVHVTLSIRTKQKVSALCLRKILLGGLDFLSATHLSL